MTTQLQLVLVVVIIIIIIIIMNFHSKECFSHTNITERLKNSELFSTEQTSDRERGTRF